MSRRSFSRTACCTKARCDAVVAYVIAALNSLSSAPLKISTSTAESDFLLFSRPRILPYGTPKAEQASLRRTKETREATSVSNWS